MAKKHGFQACPVSVRFENGRVYDRFGSSDARRPKCDLLGRATSEMWFCSDARHPRCGLFGRAASEMGVFLGGGYSDG